MIHMRTILYLLIYTYISTILLLIILIAAYLKDVRGLWPPHSRRTMILGWLFYSSTYLAALLTSLFEAPLPLEPVTRRIIGLSLLLIGSSIILWAFKAFRYTRRVVGERIDRLIRSGPYRYVRNPQYVGSVAILAGISLIQNSIHLLVFTLLQAASFHLLALLEERELTERFGSEYIKYKSETPRYIPKLRFRRK